MSAHGGEIKPKRLGLRLKLHGVMRDAGKAQSAATWALIGSDGWRIKVGGMGVGWRHPGVGRHHQCQEWIGKLMEASQNRWRETARK